MDNPTKQEWLILEVLWETQPLFLSDIIAALDGMLPWKNPTYQTYLRRMCAKGLLSYDKVRGSYAYYPLVERAACVKNESLQMIEKFKPASTQLFLAEMIARSGLDNDGLLELKRIIDGMVTAPAE